MNEGKAGVVVGVQGESEREVQDLRDAMMRKMMEEGIDEDLLDDLDVCCEELNRERESEEKKKKDSEAGNRTPVVRVTGGNTKPLYYFGSGKSFPAAFISFRSEFLFH